MKKINPEQLVEGILFLENKPVSIDQISKISGISRSKVEEIILKLNEKLINIDSVLKVLKNDNGYFHLTISPEFYVHFSPYYDTRKKIKLSKPALETLAIIAYKQPITRAEVEKIRGVRVGHILRFLIEQGLITIRGRKNVPGRPALYVTTDTFLKVFGLLSLKDLPPVEDFKVP